jgi:hypothetical protein
MARTRVRFGRLAGLVVALVVGANLVAQAASGTSQPMTPVATEVRVVAPGDTLWALAREVVGPEGDPRPVVEQLRELNGLGSEPLTVGLELRVPAA